MEWSKRGDHDYQAIEGDGEARVHASNDGTARLNWIAFVRWKDHVVVMPGFPSQEAAQHWTEIQLVRLQQK